MKKYLLLALVSLCGCVSHNTYYVNVNPSVDLENPIGGAIEIPKKIVGGTLKKIEKAIPK